jgi:Leucine-rich repeat (LRR) protein
MDENDNIHYLNIANEEYVPSSVFCFKHLKELYIRRTRFHDGNGGLPAEIERLAPTLTHLGIYNVPITHLPEQIGELKHLESLVLSNTGLITLPDSIGNLSSLALLSLPYNKLTSLPTTVLKIPLLWELILSHNPYLRSIKSINGHRYLSYLQTDNCPIEEIPVNLPQLTDLNMFNNNLTNLVNIRTLGNETESEKYFDFDKNYIRFVPPQIQYVKNLYSLNLDNNKLKMLPSDIFDIQTLDYLSIRNNSFNNVELKEIVNKFKITNPSLTLCYSSKSTSSVKCP